MYANTAGILLSLYWQIHCLPPLSHPYRISACWQVVQSYRGSEEGAETWTGEGTVCQGLHCPWRRTGHRKWRGGCDSRCLPYALANLTWFLFVVSLYTQYELVNCMQGGHAVHTHKHVCMYVCISTDVCVYIHVDWLYASVHVHFLYVHTATAEDTWTGALQWVQWEVEAAQVLHVKNHFSENHRMCLLLYATVTFLSDYN